jgi:hypothetical protein
LQVDRFRQNRILLRGEPGLRLGFPTHRDAKPRKSELNI